MLLGEQQQSSGEQKACQAKSTNRQVLKGEEDKRIEGSQQETTQKSRQNGQIINECGWNPGSRLLEAKRQKGTTTTAKKKRNNYTANKLNQSERRGVCVGSRG